MSTKSKKLSGKFQEKVGGGNMFKKPDYYKQKGRRINNKSNAKDHKVLMKIAKKIDCSETKYLMLTAQSMSGYGANYRYSNLLNPLQRGTSVQSRIGDVVKGLKLNLKGKLGWTQSAVTDLSCNVRIMIIKDTEANGAILPYGTASPGTGSLFIGADGATTVYQMYNFNNTNIDRFKIKYDKIHTLTSSPVGIAATYGVNTQMVNISLSNLGCFSYVRGNVGDITDMEESLYIFITADRAGVTFNYDSCFYFSDN